MIWFSFEINVEGHEGENTEVPNILTKELGSFRIRPLENMTAI